MSDSQMDDDSDSMLSSPAHSSTSDDPFSTPHKSRLHSVESPLVHDSSHEMSDLDITIKPSDDILPAHKSPFSMYRLSDRDHFGAERYLSPRTSVTSKSSGLSRSYSIESLAKSSVNSDTKEREVGSDHNHSFDYTLSPLTSPVDYGHQNSPKFSISTFAEDINRNLRPKKVLSSNFSISTLSVSAVTPSRVHYS